MGIYDYAFGIQPGGVLNSIDTSAPSIGFQMPQTPLSNAMMPQQAPAQAPQGILDKIGSTPGMSEGLIQMGAGLLSSNKLGPGLSAGFAGFQKGMNEGTKLSIEQLKLLKPTLTPTGQAGIMLATFPDGTQKTIVVDEAVKAYQEAEDRKDQRQQKNIDAQNDRFFAGLNASAARSDKALANAMAIATMKNGPGRSLSSTLQKSEDANFDAIDQLKLANDQISPIIQNLKPDANGKAALELGPLSNAYNASRGWLGKSTPESQKYSDLERTITQYTNESLRLNKGTQTEGDAQRAVKEVLAGFAKNDNATMTKALEQLEALNNSKIKNNQNAINRRRESQKADLYDFGAPAAPAAGNRTSTGVSYTIER